MDGYNNSNGLEMKQSLRNIFMNYTVKALKRELRKKELLPEGDKATLVSRLIDAYENSAECLTIYILNAESIQQELKSMKEKLDSITNEKKLLQQELESVKQKLNVSTKQEKELLQQTLNISKHDYTPTQRESIFSSSEIQPSSSRVILSTSRDTCKHRKIHDNSRKSSRHRRYEYEGNYRGEISRRERPY
ncbi:uncharacterized protein LOC109609898 [Camponotus floridanus]|uniref:uncharacterized protein LOC109609898 n=1 Tax=Camponotus floridanus TaxID=104421 RepID=UPI000DC6CD1E|nr:uncharacterized protein LOC109609898 [Camponotus floridanus]